MRPICHKCELSFCSSTNFVRNGSYYRTSDSKRIQRFLCKNCQSTFTSETFSWLYRHRERRKSHLIVPILASTGSLNRTAIILGLNRKTIVRKFRLASLEAEFELRANNLRHKKAEAIEFDDLETFEHTKCKPLSVTLAVESKTRRILGLEVSNMPAKGLLVKKAQKYEYRPDERRRARQRLFTMIQPLLVDGAHIRSDSNPHYPKDVKKYFPSSRHYRYLGRRGSLGGQGELKKVRFDPLFSLNHTCAMLRANVNRLIRKTWCTTKRADHLRAHLVLYANYHNKVLLQI